MIAKNWIAVASAEHVGIGRSEGFMQVCHGRAAPLRRMKAGDRVAYYSPTGTFKGHDRLQAFTAIGIVAAGAPYQAHMEDGFCPYRHDVAWCEAVAAPIRPLLDRLAFTRGNRNWGYQLRRGMFEVTEDDMALIAQAMHARL